MKLFIQLLIVLNVGVVFGQCANTYDQTVSACPPYVWEGNSYNTSGQYFETYVDQFGCDSILILNLTIVSPPVLTLHVVDAETIPTAANVIESADYCMTIIPYLDGTNPDRSDCVYNWGVVGDPTWSSSEPIIWNEDVTPVGSLTLIPGTYTYFLTIDVVSTGCQSNLETAIVEVQ